MDQIEVNIKLKANNKVYNLPIRTSETILKLKEYCQIISNIPPAQQNLLYKGKILSNEKLIKDYEIENNHDIILFKKNEHKKDNFPLQQNSDNSNNNLINEIKKFIDNKKININEVVKYLEQIKDVSFVDKIDFEKLNNFYMAFGLGKFPEIFGVNNKNLMKY